MRRLLDYYLRAMHAGELLVYPARLKVELPEPVPGSLAEDFSTHEQALAFCHTERHVIQALVTNAAERGGFDAYCWQIPRAMSPLLWRNGLLHDYLASQRIALQAVHNLGDLVGLGHVHYEFAHACALLGDTAESAAHLEQALEQFMALGDREAQAMAQDGLSQLLEQQGKYGQALEYGEESLRLRLSLGSPDKIAHSEQTIGSIYARLGQYDEALRHCRRALDLVRGTGSLLLTADTLDVLGRIHLGLGDHHEARACYLQALAIYREAGGDTSEAAVLIGLGDAQLGAGDTTAARDSWQQALTLLAGIANADDQPVRARLAQLD
jgi:tetratricopeptide (TPR) repeat protein